MKKLLVLLTLLLSLQLVAQEFKTKDVSARNPFDTKDIHYESVKTNFDKEININYVDNFSLKQCESQALLRNKEGVSLPNQTKQTNYNCNGNGHWKRGWVTYTFYSIVFDRYITITYWGWIYSADKPTVPLGGELIAFLPFIILYVIKKHKKRC